MGLLVSPSLVLLTPPPSTQLISPVVFSSSFPRGESLIFAPWGEQLARLPSIEDIPPSERNGPMKPTWATVDIDLAEVTSFREQIPLEFQKREDVYGIVGVF